MPEEKGPAPAEIPLTDLLPEIYTRVVREFTGRDFLLSQRAAVLRTFLGSIRWSVMAQTRDRRDQSRAESSPPDTLITADRFTSEWSLREELVDQIEKVSGLDRRASNLALLLIETRTDLSLAGHGSIVIEHVCKISPHTDERSMTYGEDRVRSMVGAWCEAVLSRIPPHSIGSPLSIVGRWLGWPSRQLAAFVDSLELSAVFRPVVPYRIQLLPEPTSMALSKGPTEIVLTERVPGQG